MRTLRLALTLAVTAALGQLVAVSPAHAQVKWDLSTVWPESNFHTKNAHRFAAEVKAATKGAVDISVKSGGQLGFKGPEHMRAVRDGLVPMADVLNIQQIGDEPMLGMESIPFLIASADELKVFQKHARPVYDRIAARFNQKILYIVPWPTQYLHLKISAKSIADLRSVKIRVPDKGAADMLAAVGMAPVLLPWGETIPALASGAVSGVSTSAVSGVDGKFWEFLKGVHPTNHVWSSQMVTVNLDAWKKLTPAHQAAIEALARKLEPEFWATSLKADTDSLATLKAKGMEVVAISPATMSEMRTKTAHILNEFQKRVPASQPVIKAFLAEMKR